MQRTQCNYRYRCKIFVIVESFNSILRICFLLNHDQENITRYFHGLLFSFFMVTNAFCNTVHFHLLCTIPYIIDEYVMPLQYTLHGTKCCYPHYHYMHIRFYFETISTCYNRVNVLFWLTRYLICVLLFITQRYKLSVA